MRSIYTTFLAITLLFLTDCDHGLQPLDPETVIPGIDGNVVIVEEWDADVEELRVVAFLDYPPNDIFGDVISGRARFTDPLEPLGESFYNYSLDLDPNTYQYVVAAARNGPNIFADWIVVGVYSTGGDPSVPSSVIVPANGRVADVNIEVTMQNLPPQPFLNKTARWLLNVYIL